MRGLKRNTWSAGAAVLALTILGACASSGNEEPAEPVPADTPVTVTVSNHNWNTIVVYAMSHGQVSRLGEVNTGTTSNLKTPAAIDPAAGDFQLLVDPIGSRLAYETGTILVNPGDNIRLTVENDLNLSTFSTQSNGM
jgi:hypothetical protein